MKRNINITMLQYFFKFKNSLPGRWKTSSSHLNERSTSPEIAADLKQNLLPFELTHSGWFALPIYPSWHLQTWDVREWPWRFNFPSKQNECAIFPFMCIPHGSLLSYMLWCGHFLQSVGKEKQGQTCQTIATQNTTSFPDPLLLGPRWRRRRGPGNEVAFSVVLSHCHAITSKIGSMK